MVSADVIQSRDQLGLVWARCVADRGAADVRDETHLAIRWADNAFPFWNTLANVQVDADIESLERTVREAATYMRGRTRPGFLWLFEDLLTADARASQERVVERAGLQRALSGHAMMGDILPLPLEPHHPELEFVRVRSEADALAYGELNCRAYGFGPETVKPGFSGSSLWTTDIHAYLGLRDGVPVAAGGAIAAGDCLFVILIATAPGLERRGYGEAVTRKALYEGARVTGLRRATLHATEAGRPVYERIGLRTVGSIGFYGLQSEGTAT